MVLVQAAEAQGCQKSRNLGPDVAQMVGRGEGELGSARLRPVTRIARPVGGTAGRAALAARELVEAAERPELDPHVVEEKEGQVDADQEAVGDARAREPGLGAGGGRARVPLIAHAGGGLGGIAEDDEGRLGAERVEEGRVEIRAQQEVGLAHVPPAGDGRAVDHEAVLEPPLVDGSRLEGRPPPSPDEVGEAEVDDPDPFVLDPLADQAGLRHAPRTSGCPVVPGDGGSTTHRPVGAGGTLVGPEGFGQEPGAAGRQGGPRRGRGARDPLDETDASRPYES